MGEASGRPQSMVGLHFFNPVQLMQLVEVVRTDQTDDAAFEKAFLFAESLGKTAVKCNDTPGFIVNRLLVPFLAQAMAMVDRGDATPADIDLAMRLGAGHPMVRTICCYNGSLSW
jgi:3-hydroxyacyl-CoA dehydrogenase